jgi:hypothetical protein
MLVAVRKRAVAVRAGRVSGIEPEMNGRGSFAEQVHDRPVLSG